jgi:thioesterase domain-containing protein
MLDQANKSRLLQLVPLKRGSENPPIFCAHGLGATAMAFSHLVQKVDSEHDFYGLQASGLDGLSDPYTRVEDMAQHHLAAIRERQPHGPYFLIGYSLGGLVTLEIAKLLSKDGERVALLAMLDSYPHRRYLPPRLRLRLALQKAKIRFAKAAKKEPVGRQSEGRTTDGDMIPADGAMVKALQRVRVAQYRALRTYRPSYYDGGVKFVRAAIPTSFPDDPSQIWTPLVNSFEVETIPGSHLEMLSTHVDALASAVSRYLTEALIMT